jgi:hypothetical protein
MSIAATWEEQVDFVRSMSPAAAKILWILLLSGRSLTGKDLMFTCDMSDKTILQGLTWLEFKGLIQNNGKFNGWSLTAAVRQLPLPFAALPGEGAGSVALLDGESRKISDDRENSGFLPLSSSSSSQTYSELAGNEGEEEESRESRKISDFLPNPVKDELRHCLVAAGIGKRSKKLDEILDLNLDPDFVRGHIAAREATLANEEKYPVNWLITKLLDGDPVPDVKLARCPECDSVQLWSLEGQFCYRCEGMVKA